MNEDGPEQRQESQNPHKQPTTTRASRKRKRARVCQSKDEAVARAVVCSMWDIATDWLNQSRHAARQSATRSFAFLVSPRAKAVWEFRMPVAYYDKYTMVQDSWIPTNGRTPEECDSSNKAHMLKMFQALPDLQFKVRYEVRIVGEASSITESSTGEHGEVRVLRMSINLVDEALKYLTDYFQLKEPYEFMRLSKDTTRLVFIVAMGMAHFLDQFKTKRVGGCFSQ